MPENESPLLRQPPPIYQAGSWRLALPFTRRLPPHWLIRAARWAAAAYAQTHPARLEVVMDNVRPALRTGADARRTAHALFRHFGEKLTELRQQQRALRH